MQAPSPLEVKVALLYYGLQIPPQIVEQLKMDDPSWHWGRRSGAGPAGGRYFYILTSQVETLPVVNVPLQSQLAQSSPLIVESIDWPTWHVSRDGEAYCKLQLLPVPAFHSMPLDDHLASQYAVLHATNCLATTVNQRCIYWRSGRQCEYCGIELSLDVGSTVEIKDADHILQVLALALEQLPVTHITLTTGTQPDASRGIAEYLPIVHAIKESYPEIGVHTQFEPPKQVKYIQQLKAAGCDTVGIHVEVLDDARRHNFCPGKGLLRWDDYLRAWRVAVENFGKNQVDSYILIGLESFDSLFFDRVEEMCKIGVVPYPVPVREITGTGFEVPLVDFQELVSAHRQIASLMKESGIDPGATRAGCVKCTACSAILEAFSD
jgi:radical SAM protein (TIGR04043 family)